jgi:3'(2'), 5'-bisphosphate nucleotidase/myo-inositol-1(or 4)-monophosphatase
MIDEKYISDFQDILIFGGQMLKKKRRKYQHSYKIIGTQIKAFADHEMHEYLVNHIKKIRKNILILSEEDLSLVPVQKIKTLDECFIIDPIDGTASFIHGYPGYVIQIAYLKKGAPFFSMVYAPEFDNMYTGIKGVGSYLNGQIIKVKNRSQSVVFIDNYTNPSSKISKMMHKTPGSSYIECGSIGLKICKIAEGEANILYKDVSLRDWDLIPPSLILQEAGGHVFSLKKKQIAYFLKDDYSHQGVIAVSHSNMIEKLDYLERY